MRRRDFLRATSIAITAGVGGSGVATAHHDAEIETNPIYTVTSWVDWTTATVRPTEDGETELLIDDETVGDVEDPLTVSLGHGGDYAAVSDAGEIKCVDRTGWSTDVERATDTGLDVLPAISGDTLFFGRRESLWEIEDFTGLFGWGSSPQPTRSRLADVDLPGGSTGGRNAGQKNILWKAEVAGRRLQVKTPARERYRGILGHNEPVTTANIELYDVNEYSSNEQIANLHLGYRRDSGRRPHCLSVFETETDLLPISGERCFWSVRRTVRRGWYWAKRQLGRLRGIGARLRPYLRSAAKVAVRVAVAIGSIALSFLYS